MLVHGTQHRHGRGALAVLSKTFRPELPPPAAKDRQLVSVRPQDSGGELAALRQSVVQRRAARHGGVLRGLCVQGLVQYRLRALAQGLGVKLHHQCRQNPDRRQHRIAPAHTGGMIQGGGADAFGKIA